MAYKIALVGASPAEETEFRGLLSTAAQRLRQSWEVGNERDADLVVVDVDSVFGHMAWLKANGAGKRTAAFTERDSARESDLLLGRPLSLEGLVKLLLMYNLPSGAAVPASAASAASAERETYASEFSPSEMVRPQRAAPPPRAEAAPVEAPRPLPPRPAPPPVPVAVPQPPPPAPLPPRELSLADFLTNSPLPGPARLSSEGAPDLIVDPASQSWVSSASGLRALAPHCARGLTMADWQLLNAAEFAAAKGSAAVQPYSRLLWFFTLNRSQGELLPGLERGARYKLARYPQSEREFAKHFRIGTFMMKDYASLEDIAEASGAALNDVIDYVNAYTAVGYVENDRSKYDATDPRGRPRNPFAR
ncbi:hypothetical protein DFR29_10719 [Tahibacter aquaticus]|uniref:Uncharacterized protein n=1 Tax=Tahibacter aquaticus TaxID=520092 RepID=A0A4R6YW66_9GAMM|nr:hypothetical protein [Tahibacter aquaticus]TDR43015.1 hypothetical protein DFR29_10719 [Tahibacter aquaticus]